MVNIKNIFMLRDGALTSFSMDGEVLTAPARKDLEKIDLTPHVE